MVIQSTKIMAGWVVSVYGKLGRWLWQLLCTIYFHKKMCNCSFLVNFFFFLMMSTWIKLSVSVMLVALGFCWKSQHVSINFKERLIIWGLEYILPVSAPEQKIFKSYYMYNVINCSDSSEQHRFYFLLLCQTCCNWLISVISWKTAAMRDTIYFGDKTFVWECISVWYVRKFNAAWMKEVLVSTAEVTACHK